MAKKDSKSLKEEDPVEYGGYVYHYWKFKNPRGAQVRCRAVAGTGEISLYKNNVKIGPPYQISAEPGQPTTVHLNTGNWTAGPMSVTLTTGETPLKIARRWGVSIESLLALNGLKESDPLYPGMVLRIPASEWEVWIKELAAGKNKFKVELLSE
jgi:hypothetical protein